jgi:hypothetical protein
MHLQSVTAVAFAITVLELAGHDVLYVADILTPGVTKVQIPEYKGKVDAQLCDAAKVALINSNADTMKPCVMQ